MTKPALIYIPDISGFTKFVTETEIRHSEHIISELIEVILKSNLFDFNISEIEGDAVLFYRTGEPPKIGDVIELSKQMFLNFHNHLRIIERDNVCQCGACQTVSNLTLKFITHFGNLSEIEIRDFNKIMGSDVILAHRLLKNNVVSREYLLLSEKYLETQSPVHSDSEEWITYKENIEEIDSFGKVNTKYIDFKPLLKFVSPANKLNKSRDFSSPDYSLIINAPIKFVHGNLIDANTKNIWVPGLKPVSDAPDITRINSSHTCVFDNLKIKFVTEDGTVKNNELFYSEKGELDSGFRFTTDYKLEAQGSSTKLLFKMYPAEDSINSGKQNLFQKIKNKFIFRQLKKTVIKSLINFKDYCENFTAERNQSA